MPRIGPLKCEPPGQPDGQPGGAGVSDGTRTRDIRDHNAALYQLSYTHHVLAHSAEAGA
jgi:hypothetical protein